MGLCGGLGFALLEAMKSARILVVEDDVAMAKFLELALRTRGHKLVCVKTLAEADERLRTEPNQFDLLLLDVVLPDGNGVEFFDAFEPTDLLPPTILSTGLGQDQSAQDVVARYLPLARVPRIVHPRGIVGCLTKPIQSRTMFRLVEQILRGLSQPKQSWGWLSEWLNDGCSTWQAEALELLRNDWPSSPKLEQLAMEGHDNLERFVEKNLQSAYRTLEQILPAGSNGAVLTKGIQEVQERLRNALVVAASLERQRRGVAA